MGVLGLWQLLKPTARQTKLEGLEGKTIAIDVSIWLHQATKGVRNNANGHLLVLYNRICKLLFFKIKPVFVFDGPDVPNLKQRVLQERQRRRNAASSKAKDLEEKIQKNRLEAYALKNILGENKMSDETRKLLRTGSNTQDENIDDIFKLPDQPSTSASAANDEDLVVIDSEEVLEFDGDEEDDFRFEENFDLNKVDPEVFESLPDELKYELLTQYKQKLKSKKSQTFEEFPQKSDDFSDFQMKILLHKSEISKKLSDIKSSINSTYTEFGNVFHQKVANEDDREVVLMTRKRTENVFNFNRKNDEEAEDLEALKNELNDTCNEETRPDENEYKIEFNLKNRIELVPKHAKDEDQSAAEKDFLRYLNEEFKQETASFSIEIEAEKDITSDTEAFAIPKSVIEKKNNSWNIHDEIASQDEDEIIVLDTVNSQNVSIVHKEVAIIESDVEKIADNDSRSESEDEFIEVESPAPSVKTSADELLIKDIAQLTPHTITTTTKRSLSDIQVRPCTSTQAEAAELNATASTSSSQARFTSSTSKSKLDANLEQLRADEELALALAACENDEIADLAEYGSYLAQETSRLVREQRDVDRLSHSIEQHVIDDAKLDLTDQTDGSITEDSDVWLFGAKRVYKNFFGTDQFIEFYFDKVIKTQLGFDRESLIDIAMFVGSDYTLGVESVGLVKAVEIMQEFEGDGLQKLKNFKEWHAQAKENAAIRQKMSKLRTQLLKLNVPDSFPSELVFKAYTDPNVDKSKERFTWSMPDLNLIRK